MNWMYVFYLKKYYIGEIGNKNSVKLLNKGVREKI